MRPSFHAVIFDLDGVLADSEPWWNEVDAQLLAEHGVNYRGEYHRSVLGVNYRLAVGFYKAAFQISASVEDLMRRRGEIAVDFFATRVGLFPSAKTTLEQLREMRLHLGVATSSVSASARPFLERTGIRSFFESFSPEMKFNAESQIPTSTWKSRRDLECLLRHASSSRMRCGCCRGESRENACGRDSRHALRGSTDTKRKPIM